MDTLYGVTPNIVALDSVGNNANQIILGDTSNSTIAQLAALHGVNTVDLGVEGYHLISLPNPQSGNGAWRILIVGNDSRGVYYGAMTLLDLITVNGGSQKVIGNYRVRDYPDRPFRGLYHWLPEFVGTTQTPAQYIADRKHEFRALSGTGCNALFFGESQFWRMNEEDYGYLNGNWVTEVAYWARYYGMEPIPQILPCAFNYGQQHPLFREGESVKSEPFVVTSNGQGGYVLSPRIVPFDNVANNFDFETDASPADGWPDGWDASGSISSGTDTAGRYVEYNGSSAFYLSRILNASVFQPGSFYDLQAMFKGVTSYTSSGVRYAPWVLVSARRNNDTWANASILFNDAVTDGDAIKDLYFWTPPKDAAHAPTGYTYGWPDYPYFDDFVEIRVMVYYNGGPQSLHMRLDDLFLERRDASLRNVMIAPDTTYNGVTYPGLTLSVKNKRTAQTYSEGSDYTLTWDKPLDFRMPTREYEYNPSAHSWTLTDEYVSSITWLNQDEMSDTMLVSYTLGVPWDWTGEGQRTTYCLSNAQLFAEIEKVLTDLYKEWDTSVGSMAINPKYIDIRLDELRGLNRCSRCEALGRTNAEYLVGYIKVFQQALDHLAANGYPKAAETSLICSGDMLNPYHTGGQAGYQFKNCGGQWGQSSGELSELDGTNVKLIIGLGRQYGYTARSNNWPHSELAIGQSNVSVVGSMPPPSDSPYDKPEYNAKQSTWYQNDCVGLMSYDYDVYHTEEEYRLLDYAWKRYQNPDATMHAYFGGEFVTDDVGGRTVNLPTGFSASFLPFGNPEVRDPDLSGWTISWASIYWGSGSPQDVQSSLNKALVSHTFNADGQFNVTLDVRVIPQGGGTPIAQFATIPVNVSYQQNESSRKPPETVAFGVQSIAPNPFNPTTRIRFGLSRRAEVQLLIYDVQGRRIAQLLDHKLIPAGVHTIVWDGTSANGMKVASGIYFVRLAAENRIQTRKVVLIR